MEKQVRVVQAFEHLLSEQVDPMKIIQRLWKHRALDDHEKKSLFSSCRISRKSTWNRLLHILKEKYILQQLLQSLLECCYTDLFLQIAVQYKCIENTSLISTSKLVTKTESLLENRRFSQDLFIDMKIKTHNISIGNPRDYLHDRSEQYRVEFDYEKDEYAKMIKADRLASSLCAEIDAHTMLYVHKFPTHGLFQKLKDLIPHTSNTSVTQVAYDSRLAIAFAIAKQDDEGDDHIRSAMVSSIHIEPCVELINMLYIYVFNLICIFENSPTAQTLEKIIRTAEYSMNCLSEEKNDLIRMFWMRMFYLRMVFCLIGISNKCNIISGYVVLPKHIKRAKNLLTEVDKIWNGIEARRQMFYHVAQARLAELENTIEDLELAVEYINTAVEIGEKGAFGETDSIKKYATDLADQQSRKTKCATVEVRKIGMQVNDGITNKTSSTFKKTDKVAVENEDCSATEIKEINTVEKCERSSSFNHGIVVEDNYETSESRGQTISQNDRQRKICECTLQNKTAIVNENKVQTERISIPSWDDTGQTDQHLDSTQFNFINRPCYIPSIELTCSESVSPKKDSLSLMSFDSLVFQSLLDSSENEHNVSPDSISPRRPNYFK